MRWMACLIPPVFGPCWWFKNVFDVPNKHFPLVICEEDDIKKTKIYGPGYFIYFFYVK